MKIKTFISLTFCVCFSIAFAVCASGADITKKDLTDAVPPSVKDRLPEEILAGDEITPESFGLEYVFGELTDEFSSALVPAVSSLSTLLGMLILSSSAKLFCPDRSDAVSVISSAVIGVYVITTEITTASAVENFAAVTSTFVTSLTPLLFSLHTATANTASAAVTSAGFLFFSAVTEFISTYIFIPIYKACLGFSVINAVSGGVSARVFDIIKRIFTLAISALALIYITVLSYQTSLAAATDTLASRSVKFVLSSSVPIVGGALGDAVRTTAAGIGVIKSASGALGIAVMILLAAPVAVRLLLSSAVYSAASFAADLIGCEREGALFAELRDAVGFALATVSVIAVVFIIASAIFIKTAPAVGV